MSLDKIKAPIAKEMDEFERYFKHSMRSKVPLLDIITNYIIRRKGKQIRPIFVFLTAKLIGNINKSTFHAAALIELLHTATLVHDDVVDESYQRRGFFSINALWKNKISVLVGDYLLAKGLHLAVENNEYQLLKIVSDAVKEIAEGELLQLEKSRKLNTAEAVYFDIIEKKTATLLASCTAAGAKSAGGSPEQVAMLKEFGKTIGIAFQIKDDLFDYQLKNATGKPIGNDIQERKITLPLLFTMKKTNRTERRRIKKIIQKHNNNADLYTELVNIVHEKGGIDYAVDKMIEYKNKSLEILNQFEDNEARKALTDLVNYTIEREK
jgi:octaprenyl-diphosphate synthase